MPTTLRKIVRIDEEKCDGCGQCVPKCQEGALQIVDGTAKLVDEKYCDGLGNCLGDCPRDAIAITEREAAQFDAQAVERRQRELRTEQDPGGLAGGCPGAAMMDCSGNESDSANPVSGGRPSALRQWPVQLDLVPPTAPYLDGADLLLASDCVPFAVAGFHEQFLGGRRVLMGCPKLDDREAYLDKLTEILQRNDVRSLTVMHMEVPCCYGMVAVARRALAQSGRDIPCRIVEAGIDGECEVLDVASD
jgi:Pyruvate/2-oxoacid:ferredoxin oxidoreductase delta subunit